MPEKTLLGELDGKPEEKGTVLSKSSSIAPSIENIDDRPLLIKIAAKIVPEGKVKQRLDVRPWDKQKKYWNESIFDTRQDIIKDYMVNTGSTFEEAMKWAKTYDEAHKTTPVTNFLEKQAIKKIFERDGIKRLN